MYFGQPPFAKASRTDNNYAVFQRDVDAFWRLHPSVRKHGEPVDEDLKVLLTSMLRTDVNSRPESVECVLAHPYFTKETELVNSLTNEWVDNEAMNALFREKLGCAPQRED